MLGQQILNANTIIIGSLIGGAAVGGLYKVLVDKKMVQREQEVKDHGELLLKMVTGGLCDGRGGEVLADQLSDVTASLLHYTFQVLDDDVQGQISVDKLKKRLREEKLVWALIQEFNKRNGFKGDVDEMVREMDKDNDGVISFGEYLLFFERNMKQCYHAGCLTGLDLDKAADKHVWGYSGVIGPDNWGELSSRTVKRGKKQSPIDIITSSVETGVIQLSCKYGESGSHGKVTGCLGNNGHTIIMLCDKEQPDGSLPTLVIGSEEFQLVQFHFHAAAEHLMDGVRYPLELHMVHVSKSNNQELAVIGVLFKIGEDGNDLLSQIEPGLDNIPQPKDQTRVHVDFSSTLNMINESKKVFYEGSLTTPPCSENVIWHVVRDIQTCTASQLEHLRRLMPKNNYRPCQPVCGRSCFEI